MLRWWNKWQTHGSGLLLVLASCAGFAVSPASAAVADEIALGGTGVVAEVVDGDTVKLQLEGQPRPLSFRLAGVQATETSLPAPEGMCGSHQATEFMDGLLPIGSRVRFESVKGAVSRGRPLRHLFRVNEDGTETNVQLALLEAGWAFWFTGHGETMHNDAYRAAADTAAAAGVGLWNPALCGEGPAPQARPRVFVNYNAPGVDNDNLNGEYFVVSNPDAQPLELSGWHLRDSSLNWFDFPAGTVLAPGASVKVHVGSGKATRDDFYMWLKKPILSNPGTNGEGDGGYLFDTHWNMRAWHTYPCQAACPAPPPPVSAVLATATSKSATFTWQAPRLSTVESYPADRFYVRLKSAGQASNWRLADAPATLYRNLRPATQYEIEVVAYDTAGRRSSPVKVEFGTTVEPRLLSWDECRIYKRAKTAKTAKTANTAKGTKRTQPARGIKNCFLSPPVSVSRQ